MTKKRELPLGEALRELDAQAESGFSDEARARIRKSIAAGRPRESGQTWRERTARPFRCFFAEKSPSRRWKFSGLAAAAIVALLLFAYAPQGEDASPTGLVPGVIAQHHGLLAKGPVDLAVAGNESEIGDYFQQTLGFRPVFPKVQNSEVELLGARTCSLGGAAASYVVYRWRDTLITCLMTHPEADSNFSGHDEPYSSPQEPTVLPLETSSGRLFLAADLPADQLRELFSL